MIYAFCVLVINFKWEDISMQISMLYCEFLLPNWILFMVINIEQRIVIYDEKCVSNSLNEKDKPWNGSWL